MEVWNDETRNRHRSIRGTLYPVQNKGLREAIGNANRETRNKPLQIARFISESCQFRPDSSRIDLDARDEQIAGKWLSQV
jgi:hypothetical protein